MFISSFLNVNDKNLLSTLFIVYSLFQLHIHNTYLPLDYFTSHLFPYNPHKLVSTVQKSFTDPLSLVVCLTLPFHLHI